MAERSGGQLPLAQRDFGEQIGLVSQMPTGLANLQELSGAHAPGAETELSVTYLCLNGKGRKARQKRRSLMIFYVSTLFAGVTRLGGRTCLRAAASRFSFISWKTWGRK